jgi:hypothetical protein
MSAGKKRRLHATHLCQHNHKNSDETSSIYANSQLLIIFVNFCLFILSFVVQENIHVAEDRTIPWNFDFFFLLFVFFIKTKWIWSIERRRRRRKKPDSQQVNDVNLFTMLAMEHKFFFLAENLRFLRSNYSI